MGIVNERRISFSPNGGGNNNVGEKRKKRKNKFKAGLRNMKMNDEELSAALTVRRGHWQLK